MNVLTSFSEGTVQSLRTLHDVCSDGLFGRGCSAITAHTAQYLFWWTFQEKVQYTIIPSIQRCTKQSLTVDFPLGCVPGRIHKLLYAFSCVSHCWISSLGSWQQIRSLSSCIGHRRFLFILSFFLNFFAELWAFDVLFGRSDRRATFCKYYVHS